MTDPKKPIDPISGDVAESRRKFLKTAGKFAAYTPPAMMLMMKPSYASFIKSGSGTNGEWSDDWSQDWTSD